MSSGIFDDLTGKRFGRLKVLYRDNSKNRVYWFCKCSCGNTKSIRPDSLKNGKTISCGCYHKDIGSKKVRIKSTIIL